MSRAPSRRSLLAGVALAPVAALVGGAAAAPSDADAELIRLCRADTANSRRFRALAQETATLCWPHPAAVTQEFAGLVDRTWEAREAISAIPARTMAGLRAKAEAMRADVLRGNMGDELAIADSLVDDLLRLLPAGGGLA